MVCTCKSQNIVSALAINKVGRNLISSYDTYLAKQAASAGGSIFPLTCSPALLSIAHIKGIRQYKPEKGCLSYLHTVSRLVTYGWCGGASSPSQNSSVTAMSFGTTNQDEEEEDET